MIFRSTLTLVLLVAVIACSERESGDGVLNNSYRLTSLQSSDDFLANYKKSLINFLQQPVYLFTDDVAVEESDSSGGQNGQVSSTNLQEAGVDEADRIKSSGDFLFVLNNRYFGGGAAEPQQAEPVDPLPGDESREQNSSAFLQVYKLDPNASSAKLVGTEDIAGDFQGYADGMYYHEGEQDSSLWVVSSSALAHYWYDSFAHAQSSTRLTRMQVNDPQAPFYAGYLEAEGSLVASRRVGNALLMALRYFPDVSGLYQYPETEQQKQENQRLIENADISELLPQYQDASGQRHALVTADDCYVAGNLGPHTRPDIISLVTFDLDTFSVSDSVCFIGASETLYASPDAVYLATTRNQWNFAENGMVNYPEPAVYTDIHEFSLQGGQLSYSGSGVVSGHLGWHPDRRPFRLSAHEGYLRVLTYTAELEDDQSPVRLSILKSNTASLEPGSSEAADLDVVATLPNEQRPGKLGKPGEMLYASRFLGDRAYFVTFQTIDPLYVLDLSDPTDPVKTGELYVEGYSDYLHPVSESLLIGLGKHAVAEGNGGLGDGRGAWFQGVKLSLIDVSDLANPLEVDTLLLGKRGSESNALFNHHAFTFLADSSDPSFGRLALPLSLHEEAPDEVFSNKPPPWSYYGWTKTGLALIGVDLANQQFTGESMLEVASLQAGDSVEYLDDDRSVLFDEAVYYLHGNQIFSANWAGPGAATSVARAKNQFSR